LQKGRRVVLPVRLVEVGGEKIAELVQTQWIDASHERLPVLILAREVPANDVVGYRQEPPVLALGALDSRLLADAADPLVRACRRVARLAGLSTLEAARVDVFAAAKQRAEEANLDLGRRLLANDDGSCAVGGHGTRQHSTRRLLRPAMRSAYQRAMLSLP
jgi:hypothetical protein